ncbi:MAG TPA: ABC transporter substrate-binding protein [Stellaceae bacterium]|nr:ABC transporter substrate-binding protein [Stellaceae bacterium]
MSLSRFIETIRRQAGPIENHLIDEYVAGSIGRREFLRRGTALGMAPLLGGGLLIGPGHAQAAAGKPGGTIRVALTMPAGAINPVTVSDAAGGTLLQQCGEFLVMDGQDLHLRPGLATSWKTNKDGTVWTFALRQGVKFHSGKTLVADDVVATMDRLADPKNASNALSVFKGVLSKGGTRKLDDYTVEFHLDQPHGNFAYYVSSDNYNAIILPADFQGDYEKSFDGTGPFKLEKFVSRVGASFVRNPDYWGPKALPDRLEYSFYGNQQAQILAMQGRQVDIVAQFSAIGGEALLNAPDIDIIALKSSAHTQVHMRCDMDPFKDKRVRQAVGLALNRAGLVKGLFRGRADLGNDSPFAPVFPSTDRTVPQRQFDLGKAKQLVQAAGLQPGTKLTLTAEQFIEIPQYAVLMQNALKPLGIDVDLKVESQGAYYGQSAFGKSDWLDSTMGITDYGHRGVPDVFLSAPLLSDGQWNAAHFRNKDYDGLVRQYVGAVDLKAQRDTAGKIERLLLDETPVLFGYFYNFLTATTKNLKGVKPLATAQLFLAGASFG